MNSLKNFYRNHRDLVQGLGYLLGALVLILLFIWINTPKDEKGIKKEEKARKEIIVAPVDKVDKSESSPISYVECGDEELLLKLKAAEDLLKKKEEIIDLLEEIDRLRKKVGLVDHTKPTKTSSNVTKKTSTTRTSSSTVSSNSSYSTVRTNDSYSDNSNSSYSSRTSTVVIQPQPCPPKSEFPKEITTSEGIRLIQNQAEYDAWIANFTKSGGNLNTREEYKVSNSSFYKEVAYKGGIRVFRDEGEYNSFIASQGNQGNQESQRVQEVGTNSGFRKSVMTSEGERLFTNQAEYEAWIKRAQSY